MKLIKVGLFDDAYKRTFLALASPAACLTRGGGWRDIEGRRSIPMTYSSGDSKSMLGNGMGEGS
jgi:hypothetical protein